MEIKKGDHVLFSANSVHDHVLIHGSGGLVLEIPWRTFDRTCNLLLENAENIKIDFPFTLGVKKTHICRLLK